MHFLTKTQGVPDLSWIQSFQLLWLLSMLILIIICQYLGSLATYIEASVATHWKSGHNLSSIYNSFLCSCSLGQLYPALTSCYSMEIWTQPFQFLWQFSLVIDPRPTVSSFDSLLLNGNLDTVSPASVALLVIGITSLPLCQSLGLNVWSCWMQQKMHWQMLIWKDLWSLFVMVLVYATITMTSFGSFQSRIFGTCSGKSKNRVCLFNNSIGSLKNLPLLNLDVNHLGGLIHVLLAQQLLWSSYPSLSILSNSHSLCRVADTSEEVHMFKSLIVNWFQIKSAQRLGQQKILLIWFLSASWIHLSIEGVCN